jgi:hypothetical protein
VPQVTFAVEVEVARVYAVVRPRGELDVAARRALAGALEAARATGRPVIVDLRALRFMDSSCLRLLAEDHGAPPPHLIPGRPCVQAVFDLTGKRSASRWIAPEQLA